VATSRGKLGPRGDRAFIQFVTFLSIRVAADNRDQTILPGRSHTGSTSLEDNIFRTSARQISRSAYPWRSSRNLIIHHQTDCSDLSDGCIVTGFPRHDEYLSEVSQGEESWPAPQDHSKPGTLHVSRSIFPTIQNRCPQVLGSRAIVRVPSSENGM
jgi:hypothetical protein